MKTYLVTRSTVHATGAAEIVETTNETGLFAPLRKLSESLGNSLIVHSELRITGIAIVEASDEAVQTLKSLGYSVEESGIKRATDE